MILPALLLAVILLVYFIYFTPKDEPGLYSNFDTNNNANKEIRVILVKDKEIRTNPANQTAAFYAADAAGVQNLIEAPYPLPEGFEDSNMIILRGHLHKDHFHAVEVNLP